MSKFTINGFRIAIAFGILMFGGACEHAKFRSDHGGQTNPWASPESFENSGAGTPLGLLGGQRR